MAGVAVEGLTMAFSQGDYVVKPFEGLDLTVADGELALLVGPSGSGKTTLLSCLAGILRPTAGTIRAGDVDVTALDEEGLVEYRRSSVGIVFQAFNLIPCLTALENVMAPLRLAGVRRRAAEARAVELLGLVGLAARSRHVPTELSGGQQQRVAVARALAWDPPFILADEPTAHLDYVQLEGVVRILREVACPGRAVLVSTHDDRLQSVADRVIDLTPSTETEAEPAGVVLLHAGQLLFEQGDPSDAIYVVRDGVVELFRRHQDGTEEVLRAVTAGGYFGEMGPMLGIPRTASARAVEDSTVDRMRLRDFRRQFVERAPMSHLS